VSSVQTEFPVGISIYSASNIEILYALTELRNRHVTIKIISITPPSVIKIYLYVYMPLHVSVDNNHHQKANQHRKETTIT
jgi:hypothetical protein